MFGFKLYSFEKSLKYFLYGILFGYLYTNLVV